MEPNEKELEEIKKNIFPEAWQAIRDPMKFPWHRNIIGRIDTCQPNSSQALCIDLFMTLKKSPARVQILNKIAKALGLDSQGCWKIHLEWTTHGNPLRERRRSQVDAVAIGDTSIILFECKFTEHFGDCRQPYPLKGGEHDGEIQCSGNYEPQTNPVNGKHSFCALTEKRIRYWDYVPKVFEIDPDMEHRPCPFRDEWYQLMRNLTLAAALREKCNKSTAVVVVHAGHRKSPMAKWLQPPNWAEFENSLKKGGLPFDTWSYAAFIKMIQEADPQNNTWSELACWVSDKINAEFSKAKYDPQKK